MTKIDKIQASDKEAICQMFRLFLQDQLKWWKKCYQTNVELKEDLDEKQWTMLNEASTDSSQLVRVARNDNEMPVGIIWAVIKDDEWFKCRIGQIYWISIGSDFQKSGIGTKLMGEAEEWFLQMQVQGKRVFVSTANDPAINLYQKFGYEVIDYRMLGPGKPHT